MTIERNEELKKGQYLAIWMIAACMGIAYLLLCFNHNVWADEAYTLAMIKNDYAGIIGKTAVDVHPPLYYFIAKTAALLFPTHEYRLLVQKIVSIIPVALTLGIGGSWLYAKGFGMKAAAIFQIMLGMFPFTMEYAVQLRMYSWALLFITVCGLAAYDAYVMSRKRDWILFALMGVAASYTHNYAFISASVICGLLFLCIVLKNRERLLPWAISSMSMVLVYLPWFRIFLRQAGGTMNRTDYWIEPITWETVWGYFTWAFENDVKHTAILILCILAVAGIVNVVLIAKKHRTEDVFALLCWSVPFFTALGGVIISLIKNPIYYNRYAFPAMGLLCVFLAISLRGTQNPFFVSMMLFLACYGVGSYREAYHQEYNSSYVRQTEAFFEEYLGEGDVVLYNWEINTLVYRCHFEEDQLFYMLDFDLGGEYDNIWFLDTYGNITFPQYVLEAYNLTSEYVGHLGVEMNEFDVYRIYRTGVENEEG